MPGNDAITHAPHRLSVTASHWRAAAAQPLKRIPPHAPDLGKASGMLIADIILIKAHPCFLRAGEYD